MTNKEKIKRAIWMYNTLISVYPTMYSFLKQRYEELHSNEK